MEGKLLNYLREKNISMQFFKFGIVGVSNTVLSLIVTYSIMFVFKYRFGIYEIWSLNLCTTAGYGAGVLNSYFWNNKYVFRNSQEKSTRKKLIKVFICYGITYLLSMIMMDLLVGIYHVPETIAPIPRLLIIIPFNYIANKFWVYKDKD